MFKKKYRKSSSVVLILFLLALILVAGAVVFAYVIGMRYIKTTSNTKFFGFVDKNGEIDNGKFWLEDGTTVKIETQDYYIVEVKDFAGEYMNAAASSLYKLATAPGDYILDKINEAVPAEITEQYPLNHFLFNNADAGVIFYKNSLANMLKECDAKSNPPVSGEFYTVDGNEWTLSSTKSDISSYKDFDIVLENDKSRRYNGDIPAFIAGEQIAFAAITLKDENLIYIYPAGGIYRFEYEKGNNKDDLYIGEIKENFQKDGMGIYYFTNTGMMCYGSFESDKKTGMFKVMYAEGDTYDGGLIDGKKNGDGIFKWANGTIYEGNFKDDMKDGMGINRFTDGSAYEGDYVEDAKHGTGKYTFANGDVYEGSFEDDVFSGKGSYVWASGEYYEGEFAKNTIHGEGVYTWMTGRTWTGKFENGTMLREN